MLTAVSLSWPGAHQLAPVWTSRVAPADPVCRAAGSGLGPLVLIALTNDGDRIVVLDTPSGAVLHSFEIGPVGHIHNDPAHVASLAFDARHCEVLAAAVDSARDRTRVLALSLRNWQLRPVATLDDSVGYPWVSIGSITGRIFLVGRRGLQVTALDWGSWTIVERVRDTLSNPNRWVYQARISPDEKRAYVSYHGGMNWVDLATGAHCVSVNPGERFHYGCNSDVHAAFDFIGDDIVAADGVGVQVLDANGVMKASLDIGLIDDYALPPHFMDIGVDPHHRIVFGTMICPYGRGVMSITIPERAAAGAHASLVSNDACGNRLTFSEDATTLMVLNYAPGVIDLARREPGGITARITLLPAEDRLVDVVAVRTDNH
jgi:hypothetical protein